MKSARMILSSFILLFGMLLADTATANPCLNGACLELRLIAANDWSLNCPTVKLHVI